MRKTISLTVLHCLFLCGSAFAQQDEEKKTKPGAQPPNSNATKEDNFGEEGPSGGGFGGFGGGDSGFGGGYGGGDSGGMAAMGMGMGMGGYKGGHKGGFDGSPKRFIADQNLIISWPKTNDQLRGFSLTNGTWTTISIPKQESLNATTGDNVACIRLDKGIAAFSSTKQKWSLLNLPDARMTAPEVSDDLVTVHQGDHIYTFAASSGRWTSPTDERLEMISDRIPGSSRRSALPGMGVASLGPSKADPFGISSANKTSLEMEMESVLRRNFGGKVAGQSLSVEDKESLRKLVTKAFDERLEAQQEALEDLRRTLKSVEAKLKTRTDNRAKIIDRRIDELMNPDLDWNQISGSK